MDKPILCSVCGDKLPDDMYSFVNFKLLHYDPSAPMSPLVCAEQIQKVKDMFGTAEFNVCFCCWIKSFGVKQKEYEDDIK